MPDPIRLQIIFRPGMDPSDRQWFEEQLEDAFANEGLGQVIGGGTAMDGTSSDIALEVNKRVRGIAVIRDVLRREQAPRDTRIIQRGTKVVTRRVYDAKHAFVELEPQKSVAKPVPVPREADLPQLGDTYLVPMDKGLFGACRVIAIRNGQYGTLVAGTDWFGKKLPLLSEPRLRKLLVLTYVGATGPSAKYWLAGKPPKEFRYLGVIKPSAKERRMDSPWNSHQWSTIAALLLSEWKWMRKKKP